MAPSTMLLQLHAPLLSSNGGGSLLAYRRVVPNSHVLFTCRTPTYRLHMNTRWYSYTARYNILSLLRCQKAYLSGGTGGRTPSCSLSETPLRLTLKKMLESPLVRSTLSPFITRSTDAVSTTFLIRSLLGSPKNLPLLVTSGKNVPSLTARKTLANPIYG